MDPALEKLDVQDPAGIEAWHERFDLYVVTNDKIKDSNKTAWYLTSIGKEAYDLLKELSFPGKPKDKTVAELQQLLQKHLKPCHFEATERAKFHNIIRQPEEPLRAFLLRLQRQASKCNFNAELETQLRDRVVAGINDKDVQKRLLTRRALTFEQVTQILETWEDVNTAVSSQEPARVLYHERSTPDKAQKPFNRGRKPRENRHFKQQHLLKPNNSCNSCGGLHLRSNCKFRDAECRRCHKTGHIQRVCRSAPVAKTATVTVNDSSDEDFTVLAVQGENRHLIQSLKFPNGSTADFIIDTGSPVSFMALKNLRRVIKEPDLQSTSTTITSVTGHQLPVLGKITVEVKQTSQSPALLQLLVTETGPSVLGLDGLRACKTQVVLNTSSAAQLPPAVQSAKSSLPANIIQLIEDCGNNRGGMKVDPVDLEVDHSPIFRKVRPIALNLREAVAQNLKDLVAEGILSPVNRSSWATPIVTPLKSSGLPRICGDFRITVNPWIKQTATTTRTVEDMFEGLLHSKVFSKLDLTNAFLQIPLAESSKPITTIHTPWGLFFYNFLPFGLSVSPGIFQHAIDDIISNIEGVKAYQDDLIVHGTTQEQHDKRLATLLHKLKERNVRINPKKSIFAVPSLNFLGYRVDGDGIRPDMERIKAIEKAPRPTSSKQLQSFLGFAQYYAKFVPGFASLARPLFDMLTMETFEWTNEAEENYNNLMTSLLSSKVLRSFQVGVKSEVVVDASEFAIGAVLEQNQHPVLCVSRQLSPAECNYSQTQREALAVVWAVRRLHKYLYGSTFRIVTDHKALEYIFQPSASLNKTTSAMLQRWAIELAAYSYEIQHRAGKSIPHADYLSRHSYHEPPSPETCGLLFENAPLPIDRNVLIKETKLAYGSVIAGIRNGWSTSAKNKFPDLHAQRAEMNLAADGVIMMRERPLIPPACREIMLSHLHQAHLGRDKMLSLAKLLCWWPSIRADIITFVRECASCQQKPRTHKDWRPWPFAFTPMQRLHMDYCGPFLGRFYALVLVDAFSRFPEVFITTSATATFTKRALRRFFAREGVPQVVVSDNGRHFTGDELQSWLRSLSCESIFTAPRHPCSNGLAENFVKSLKAAIFANSPTTEDELNQTIDTFLLQYRNSTHATTGKPPAEIFRGRNLRMPGNLDSTSVTFFRGNNSTPCRGLLLAAIGNRMFDVLDLDDGSIHRRHKDQVNVAAPRRAVPANTQDADFQQSAGDQSANMGVVPEPLSQPPEDMSTRPTTTPASPEPPTPAETIIDIPTADTTPPRRSTRNRKIPARYKDFILQGRSCDS